MKLKLSELIDAFDNIHDYENIVLDKEKNEFIFLSDFMMSTQEMNDVLEEIDNDEVERYACLPSRYVFHDSEIAEEFIETIDDPTIYNDVESSFYGKGKYRRFKDTLRRFHIEDKYYQYREDYLKNMAIEWCKDNNVEYEEWHFFNTLQEINIGYIIRKKFDPLF